MEAPAARPQRALVLVVDDEEDMLEIFSETLARIGVEVIAEKDPRRAAAAIQRGERFDLVVLDLHMRPIDGVELLSLLRERQPEVPALIVTGYPSAETADRCRALGVLQYMRKPFDPDELSRQVRRALCPIPPKAP